MALGAPLLAAIAILRIAASGIGATRTRGSSSRAGRASSRARPVARAPHAIRAFASALLTSLSWRDHDDFLLAPTTGVERRDLLEVLEDRYGKGAFLVVKVPMR
jgi:hypothetical protein